MLDKSHLNRIGSPAPIPRLVHGTGGNKTIGRLQEQQRVERSILILLCVSTFAFLGMGATWDHHWHGAVGRDAVISPPHLVIYVGTLLSGGAAGIAALRSLLASRRAVSNTLVIWVGSEVCNMCAIRPGYRIVIAGSAFMAVSASLDVLWHRTIGDTTIWSPPHVMAILAGIVIATGAVRALFETSRDGVLPPRLGTAVRSGFPAMLLITAYFGVLPAAVLAFVPARVHYAFFSLRSPYIVAAVAALLMPTVIGIAGSLGTDGWRSTVGVGVGGWVVQEAFALVTTPIVAGMFGYRMHPYPFPNLKFDVIALAFMLVPALLTAPLITRRPALGGAVCGLGYTVAVVIGLRLAGLDFRLSVAAVGAPVAIGLISGLAGVHIGRWLHLLTGSPSR